MDDFVKHKNQHGESSNLHKLWWMYEMYVIISYWKYIDFLHWPVLHRGPMATSVYFKT